VTARKTGPLRTPGPKGDTAKRERYRAAIIAANGNLAAAARALGVSREAVSRMLARMRASETRAA
jgi:transcriptional regulator of acetoin/glycerol metabolism